MHQDSIKILDCTLRDGSYAIDFQFTARETAIIASALENAGIRFIEIGHGLGLNAARAGHGASAATDEEYLQAASRALSKAQWGMFFIPGVGRHKDLELAASYGMHFVRIGANVTEIEVAESYIAYAKQLGIFVSVNLMKSYVLPPGEVATRAKWAEGLGADLVYLVDSAGGMLPEDVRRYVDEMKNVLSIPIGFHGHDNLSLATANTLMAIECGATYVDTTLQGLGRSSGNVATEVMATILKKQGLDLAIDIMYLMDIGQRLIKPMLQERGYDPIGIISGYAQFHSSYLKTILKYADLYKVDPRDLIIGVCEVDRVHVSDELVEGIAKRLAEQSDGSGRTAVEIPSRIFLHGLEKETSDLPLDDAIRRLAHQISVITKKRSGTKSVLNIVAAPVRSGTTKVSRFIHENFGFAMASVEVDNLGQLEIVIKAADGQVDILLVDADEKPYLGSSLFKLIRSDPLKSRLIGYQDCDVWVRSIVHELWFLTERLPDCIAAVCGTDAMALKLALILVELGVNVTLTGGSLVDLERSVEALIQLADHHPGQKLRYNPDPVRACLGADILVGFAEAAIGPLMVEAMNPKGLVFDAGIGAASPESIAVGHRRGIRMVRPDMRAALAGELAAILGAGRVVTEIMGRDELAGVSVVAGGVIGARGDVVVDTISNPEKVIGIADGLGRLLEAGTGYHQALRAVEEEIIRRKVYNDSIVFRNDPS